MVWFNLPPNIFCVCTKSRTLNEYQREFLLKTILNYDWKQSSQGASPVQRNLIYHPLATFQALKHSTVNIRDWKVDTDPDCEENEQIVHEESVNKVWNLFVYQQDQL